VRLLRLIFLLGVAGVSAPAAEVRIYLGTYTESAGATSKGIYTALMNTDTGRFGDFTVAAEMKNPSFLALAPDHQHLYAVSELGLVKGVPAGAVNALAVDSHTGALTLLNQVSSGGAGPCHLGLDPSGRTLLVANYDDGSIAALPVLADGRLGSATSVLHHEGHSVDPKRQTHAHAHSVNFSPDGRFAFVDDLGLDKLFVYRLDAGRATLVAQEPASISFPPGSGPRHFALLPDGRHAYVITEMGGTIIALDYDAARGTLAETQAISTRPADFIGTSGGAEIAVPPSGHFVYASNRGPDSIAVFQVDSVSGRLALVETVPTRGHTPRNFAIDPSGRWLIAANQSSNTLAVFSIDASTGRLTPAGPLVSVPAPACVLFAD
jgi:6-phosphogluconolactonase